MAAAKRIPLLALAALAACAHPAPPPGTPNRAELASALMPVDVCLIADPADGDCQLAPSPDKIRVHAARCVPLPPRAGNPTALCRVTYSWIYGWKRPDTSRGKCVRLMLFPAASGHGPYWSWDSFAAEQRDCKDRGL